MATKGISPFKLDTCKQCASRYDCPLSKAFEERAFTRVELESVAERSINFNLFILNIYSCFETIGIIPIATAGIKYNVFINPDFYSAALKEFADAFNWNRSI